MPPGAARTGWRLERVLGRTGVNAEGALPGENLAANEGGWWEKLWK